MHVFLTIDTELRWSTPEGRLSAGANYARSVEPAGVGLTYQLKALARHGLKATFFVDPMPALAYGLDPVRRMVEPVLAAGQEVQLHLHPCWHDPARFELIDYAPAEQRALLEQAIDLLLQAGAPRPVAFRAGAYAANDATLATLADLGLAYDSSHNGAWAPWPSQIGLPPAQIAPLRHAGIIEVPVTLIQDRPGRLRNAQICALSAGELAAALDHGIAHDHQALVLVGHSFELANRAGTGANAVHVRRFDALCAMLAARRDAAPTAHFADHPALALDRADVPLPPSRWRTGRRQVEQLWSNLVAERAA